jgi:hypothetical protein
MKIYPCWRVLIGFSLCPGLAGFVLGFLMALFSALSGHSKEDVRYIFLSFFILPLLGVATAIVLNIVPAFFLAIFSIFLKLHKNLNGYIFVAIFGGVGAMICDGYIRADRGELFVWIFSNFSHSLSYFLLGVISSITMANFVLPTMPTK